MYIAIISNIYYFKEWLKTMLKNKNEFQNTISLSTMR